MTAGEAWLVPESDSRRVPAAHGWRWVRDGLEILAAAPAVWVGMATIFLMVAVVLGIIPFASLLFTVAVPILIGGVLLACEDLRHGRPPEVRDVFRAFEAPWLQPLALTGTLYLAGTILVALPVIGLAVMGALTTAAVGMVSPRADLGMFAAMVMTVALVWLASIAMSMALWFAPALVIFQGETPIDALKRSWWAAWRNIPAFLVFGAAMIGLGLVLVAPLFGAVLVAARLTHEAASLALILLGGAGLFVLCGMLLIMPTTWGAMYASYRDVFEDR